MLPSTQAAMADRMETEAGAACLNSFGGGGLRGSVGVVDQEGAKGAADGSDLAFELDAVGVVGRAAATYKAHRGVWL